MRREGWRAVRNRQNAVMREVMAAVEAADAAEREALKEARRKAAEVEAARVRFTAEDLAGARAVRDRFGWHRVVKVNAKSVTVGTPYSWTDRIPVEKVLEVLK